MRLAQPVAFCQAGLGSYAEQPEPVPSSDSVFQTLSSQPRAPDDLTREVPPTEVT
ncbi:hypothetical protein [Streptomyces sp. NPDC093060]|uniref:hypothetical protein n=1 Tax=Streptomyces sp. NPDC093060 TaxID=3366019 RepID=UPI0037FBAFBF